MPVNHAKKFLKFVHDVAFFGWLFSETLNFDFSLGKHFSENFFSEKSFQMDSTISGLMCPKIRHKWNYSNVHCLVSKTILIKKKAEKILKHFFILVSWILMYYVACRYWLIKYAGASPSWVNSWRPAHSHIPFHSIPLFIQASKWEKDSSTARDRWT